MIDLEPQWRKLEVFEADLARLKQAGAPGWEEATKAVATLRATIKELQRANRAKPLPEEIYRTDKSDLKQERSEREWIEGHSLGEKS
jgi:hypothetical protein